MSFNQPVYGARCMRWLFERLVLPYRLERQILFSSGRSGDKASSPSPIPHRVAGSRVWIVSRVFRTFVEALGLVVVVLGSPRGSRKFCAARSCRFARSGHRPQRGDDKEF
jgi:hypothetical protein